MNTGIPEIRWVRTIDGASIDYQDFGQGPVTLVVIPGWISHLEILWEQPRYVRFMRRLARDMRMLVFDKRGLGMSASQGVSRGRRMRPTDVRELWARSSTSIVTRAATWSTTAKR